MATTMNKKPATAPENILTDMIDSMASVEIMLYLEFLDTIKKLSECRTFFIFLRYFQHSPQLATISTYPHRVGELKSSVKSFWMLYSRDLQPYCGLATRAGASLTAD